jgi:hypothetical protein
MNVVDFMAGVTAADRLLEATVGVAVAASDVLVAARQGKPCLRMVELRFLPTGFAMAVGALVAQAAFMGFVVLVADRALV